MGFGNIIKAAMPVLNPANALLTGGAGLLSSDRQAKNDASNMLQYGAAQSTADVRSGSAQAKKDLAAGVTGATGEIGKGYDEATGLTKSGYGQAASDYAANTQNARNAATQGFGKAQGYYETAPVIASRQELYSRVLGQGGLSPETMAAQKAGTIEDYGTAMKAAKQAYNPAFGDSTATGLAGENLARAESSLGAERANALRALDIQNEQLKRQEQGQAITSLEQEAGARAGLSQNEAQYMGDLEQRFASGMGSLTGAETQALSALAQSKGQTLGQLQYNLGTGNAQISEDEAKMLAEIMSNMSSGIAGIKAQPSLGQQLAVGFAGGLGSALPAMLKGGA